MAQKRRKQPFLQLPYRRRSFEPKLLLICAAAQALYALEID